MRDDDVLPPELERAVGPLREAPRPRREWLDHVVEQAAGQRLGELIGDDDWRGARSRRWSAHPAMAIAAGLLCMVAGAGGTYAVMGRARGAGRPSPDVPALQAEAVGRAPVRFTVAAPGAVNVSLVGDFNEWNPVALPMTRLGDGTTWEVEIPLAPGRYTYAFVVDGRLARDPSAPQAARDDFGAPSSVVLVRGAL